MKILSEIKKDLLKMDGFYEVKIDCKTLFFKIRNFLINQLEYDEVECYFALSEDGALYVEQKDGEELIQSCTLICKVLDTEKLLEVLYNREKFEWKGMHTSISENYYWINFQIRFNALMPMSL